MSDANPAGIPVPANNGTVFISYARIDDDQPPLDQAARGWVKFFWDALRWELTQRGLPDAKLWLDRYQIEPAELFTDKIKEALQEARVIIAILSPNWLTRDWCLKEVDWFEQLHANDGIVKDGIVPVIKLEVPSTALPAALQNREGYRFFMREATGTTREFYWWGLKDRDAYSDVITRIALWIAGRLAKGATASPAPAKAATVPAGQVVYLAAATDELRDAWQRVANDLEGAGYVVYPATGGLPDTAAKAETAIREGLAKAVLSVHFLGDSEGAKPDGSADGIVRLQLRIAREISAASGAVPRVLWVPKWLPGNRDIKRDPFEVLKKFGAMAPGEEVYAEEATDLSQMLRARLAPTPTPAAGNLAPHLLIAAAAPEDDGLAGMLANRLQSDEVNVKPRFSDDPEPSGNLDQAKVVLLPWANASRDSMNTLLDALVANHARVTVLALPGGDAVAKQRFFRAGVYVEQLAEIPPDRKSARELLVRLEILPQAAAQNARS